VIYHLWLTTWAFVW